MFSQYEGVAHFSADMHHVFIQARADPQRQCFKLPYVVTEPDIRRIVQLWPAEWLKDLGKKPSIPVPPATNIGAGTSQAQQQSPLEDSEDLSDSQMDDDSQGGDGGQDEQDEQDEESVKTISNPNPPTKCKSPEVAEVTKPQSRKKAKALKEKYIEEEATVTLDALEQALE